MTFRNFINSGIRHSAITFAPVRWPYAAMFRKLTFQNCQTAECQCKCHREHSGTVEKSAVASLCPLKFKKKMAGPPVYEDGLFELSIDPLLEFAGQYL
jgi:hypothetical protein